VKSRLALAVCLLAIAAIAVTWLRPDRSPRTNVAPEITASTPQTEVVRPEENIAAVNEVPSVPTQPDAPSTTDPTATFRIDGSGNLILDEQTRLNMEALLAKTNPADRPQAQAEVIQKLPPAAAEQASALLDHFQNYSTAQRQAYPPGAAPATEEAALAELDGLHALRVAHFGSDVAHALYGAEEGLTRSLIELMRLEKDQSLTLEEKAARAQQLYDTLPELSRVQRSN